MLYLRPHLGRIDFMRLNALLRHNVQIDFVDGDNMIGYVDAYISEENNYPDPESIILICKNQHFEISIDEIKDVTVLDD